MKLSTATTFDLTLPIITGGQHCGECFDVFTGGKSFVPVNAHVNHIE